MEAEYRLSNQLKSPRENLTELEMMSTSPANQTSLSLIF